MRLDVPDIYWHGPKDRVLALAFSPSGDTLITAGTVDSEGERSFMRVFFPQLYFLPLAMGSQLLQRAGTK